MTYDAAFYERIRGGSSRSAQIVCGMLHGLLSPASVLDVGCGDGSWLAAWRDLGVHDTLGVDGAYVEREQLRVPGSSFNALDLSKPFDLRRRFALVQSLEVAEHLPEEVADAFVESVARHGDKVLFSAAPPGQFGNHHVNERPYEYWRARFDEHGFDCYDVVRKRLSRDARVEPWYRYNSFLYIRRGSPVPVAIAGDRVDRERRIRDVAPLAWRVRRSVFRLLPPRMGTLLARLSIWLSNSRSVSP